MIPSWNILTRLQRVRAAAVTLCVVLLFLQTAVAQDTIKPVEGKSVEGSTSVIRNNANSDARMLQRMRRHQTAKVNTEKDASKAVAANDTLATDTVPVVPQHSPTKALWMSAVLPGLGQVYNRQAWKIPIIYAGAAGVTYFAITNYRNREMFKNELINRQNGNTDALLERYANYPDANIYSIYQSYNRNFQLSLIIGGVFYALNIIDAYVYGHLFDFEINEDISLHLRPNVEMFDFGNGFSSPSTGLTVQIKF